MYKNIGQKIKSLSKTIAWIEAFMALIIGTIPIIQDEDMAFFGLTIIAIGIILSWVSSWLLYGFGEIVEKVCLIEENTRNGAKKSEINAGINAQESTKQ